MAENDGQPPNTGEITPVPRKRGDPSAKTLRASRDVVSMKAEFYSGMLPHPEVCAKMEELCPGFTGRLLAMTEAQTAHRIEIEKSVIIGGSKRSDRGLNYGLVVVLAFLIVSAWLIYTGHDTAGGIMGTLDIVALAGTFVYGRAEQQKERVTKEKEREEVRDRVRPDGRERHAQVHANRTKEEVKEDDEANGTDAPADEL